jgi:hypothetical protein
MSENLSTKLQKMEPQTMALQQQPTQGISLQVITEKIMSGELTKEKLDMVERLVAMDAERQFAEAFVALQSEMPKVKANKPVPNNDGSTRYTFATFEEIMRQVAPLLQKYAFTVSFSSRTDDKRIIQICTLQHRAGHKRINEFAVRIGQGPPKASEAQADGAAGTYAKRFALTDALNIVVSHLDNDASLEGAPVTQEQADELERRVALTNSDKKRFLEFAGATSFATISAGKYDICDEFLRRKEQRR